MIVLHAKCDILCFRFIFCSNFGNVIQTKILSFTNGITMHGRLAISAGSCAWFKSASHKKSLSLWNTAIWKIIEWWLGGRNASLRNYTTISLAFTTILKASVRGVAERERRFSKPQTRVHFHGGRPASLSSRDWVWLHRHPVWRNPDDPTVVSTQPFYSNAEFSSKTFMKPY